MTNSEFKELARKYEDGTATSDERRDFEEAYNLMLKRHQQWDDELMGDEGTIKSKILDSLVQEVNKTGKRNTRFYFIPLAAAVIIIALVTGIYLYRTSSQKFRLAMSDNPIKPGSNKAILTLAGGQRVILTDKQNGPIATQSGVQIAKTAGGKLIYQVINLNNKPVTPQYNTIETPVGGQFQVNLPDGTRVWLNSASSLRYPVNFSGRERVVQLAGEGYFEVAHNKVKPFKVISNSQQVEVLGTHFNINAYADEHAVKTTLLEGSVKVTTKTGSVMIKPNQAAVMTAQGLTSQTADTEEAVAWKNGYFRFNGERIESIMRKLAHWYNIDVLYDHVTDEVFYGTISRFKNINEVLMMLEATQGVHFKIEGRRITVMH